MKRPFKIKILFVLCPKSRKLDSESDAATHNLQTQ